MKTSHKKTVKKHNYMYICVQIKKSKKTSATMMIKVYMSEISQLFLKKIKKGIIFAFPNISFVQSSQILMNL